MIPSAFVHLKVKSFHNFGSLAAMFIFLETSLTLRREENGIHFNILNKISAGSVSRLVLGLLSCVFSIRWYEEVLMMLVLCRRYNKN